MKKVAIIGAGARAKLATEIFELNGIEIQGYVSSEPRGTIISNRPVICSIEEFELLYKELKVENIFIGMGDNVFRKKIREKFNSLNISYINCIHPLSYISKDVLLGEGIYIDHSVIIQNGVKIGDHSHLGVRSTIGHDSHIGDLVNIAPTALVCGGASIKDLAVIGPNATVLEKRTVGDKSIVAAGSVVTQNIDGNIVVGGLPAKYIKERDLTKSYLK